MTFTPNGDQGVAVANYTKSVSLSVSWKAELTASIPNQTAVYGTATADAVTAIETTGADDVVYSGFVAGVDVMLTTIFQTSGLSRLLPQPLPYPESGLHRYLLMWLP